MGEKNSNQPIEESKEQHQVENSNNILTVSGMYKNWFLDYASYVILERAVPHIHDGLKPVQRRILYAMKLLDDGRYNKVANIIGFTMQFHPHGDASIGDALVQLGQKNLLIDTQGNWGNILTGDSAAAPRYIEARLSKFALEVLFNNKTTEWKPSYDGRNNEPLYLPAKFPLLLAQGVEGIAVGMASKILPHNFNELIDASISYLKGKSFEIYPDFQTGGFVDVSRYNDGLRGGKIKIRAKIDILDKKILQIVELPFGQTTTSLIDSIVDANEKSKIKIKKIEDKTSDAVNIIIHIGNDVTPDQLIDALYAFTNCEVSISPNSSIIDVDKPKFLGVTEILKRSADNTLGLLKKELEIEIAELNEAMFFASLEKIFIENKIYLSIEECTTFEEIIETIDKGLEPFKKNLIREVTRDDIVRLTEIKIKRISKFDSFKADELLKGLQQKKEKAQDNLDHIVDYTIAYFKHLKTKYGKGQERKSQIRNFEDILVTQVAVANKKLYVNYKDGFIGTEIKDAQYVFDCSEFDDILIILNDGTYFITKVTEKTFVGNNILYVDIFHKNNKRMTYNVVYMDGKTGYSYAKRFNILSLIREKKYNITQGAKYSKILYFTANPNAEAEVVVVKHKPRPRLKKLSFEFDFSTLGIRNKSAKGNLLTKYPVHKITMKEKGESTIGGIKVWFDTETLRLKTTEADVYIGEIFENDLILVVYKDGTYKTIPFDIITHFDDDVLYISKYQPETVYNSIYYNAEQGYPYLKRFKFDKAIVRTKFIDDKKDSYNIDFTDYEKPMIEVIFGGKDKNKEPKMISAEEHIAVKSVNARGKRLITQEFKKISFIIPKKPDFEEQINEPKDNGPNDKETKQDSPKKNNIDEKTTQEKTNNKKEDKDTSKIEFEVKMPNGKKIKY